MVNEINKKEIVEMILNGKTEEALRLLSEYYGIESPNLKVGLPRGKNYVLACYVPKKNTIYFKKGEYMRNPFIVLHEFYHAIRFSMGKHRGNEKLADEFAINFLK
ncbi:MAG TPA: hypothetical protein VKU94_03665 [Geobacterales bacterium]|nr:hypothetical protein [Geobacterales bacterium]